MAGAWFDFMGERVNAQEQDADERYLGIRARMTGGEGDVCPLCNKGFQEGDKLFWLMNNCKFFPNVPVHGACADPIGLEQAYLRAKESYDAWKRAKFEYRAWHKEREGGAEQWAY